MFFAFSAKAALITITAQEVGSDVIFSASGSVDLNGVSFIGNGTLSNGPTVRPNRELVLFGATNASVTLYGLGSNWPLWGTGSNLIAATSSTGDTFGFANGVIFLPTGYQSLSALSATMIFANQSFQSLGITPGTYSFAAGNSNNSAILNVLVAEVPIPAALPLFVTGLLGLGLARIRKFRIPKLH